MVPLAIYGLQRATDFGWTAETIDLRWYRPRVWRLINEAGTIMAALVALRYVRFSLFAVPIIGALWMMSLDLLPMLLGAPYLAASDHIYFGIFLIALAYLIDRRTPEDYAFWGYLFGVGAFWCALTSMDSDSEIGKLIYCGINLGLMLLSVLIARRAFILFGAAGVLIYLGYLAEKIFKDSLLFPLALTILGVAIIYLGTRYQRNRSDIEQGIVDMVPDRVRGLLPRTRPHGEGMGIV